MGGDVEETSDHVDTAVLNVSGDRVLAHGQYV